jgi:hypothetical protein
MKFHKRITGLVSHFLPDFVADGADIIDRWLKEGSRARFGLKRRQVKRNFFNIFSPICYAFILLTIFQI